MDTSLTTGFYSRQTSEDSQLDSGFWEGDDDIAILRGQISGKTVTEVLPEEKKLPEGNDEEQLQTSREERSVTKAPCMESIYRQFQRDLESIRPLADKQVTNGDAKPQYSQPVAIIKYMQKSFKKGTQPVPDISAKINKLKESAKEQIVNIEKFIILSKVAKNGSWKPLSLTLAPETQRYEVSYLLEALVSYYVLLGEETKARLYISTGYSYYGENKIIYFLDNADYDLKEREY